MILLGQSVSLLKNYLTHFVFLKLSVNVFCQFVSNFFDNFWHSLDFFGVVFNTRSARVKNYTKKLSKMPQIVDKIQGKKFSRQKNINTRLSGIQRGLNSYCLFFPNTSLLYFCNILKDLQILGKWLFTAPRDHRVCLDLLSRLRYDRTYHHVMKIK